LAYFQCQDGDFLDDVIDQCVLDTHAFPSHHYPDNPVFHDAHETEIGSHQKFHPEPTPSGKVVTKRDPDFDQLRPLFGWLSTDIINKHRHHQ
jgi:hypothetical protein